jgi:hypothetical protein
MLSPAHRRFLINESIEGIETIGPEPVPPTAGRPACPHRLLDLPGDRRSPGH